jgi:IS30 family transposase
MRSPGRPGVNQRPAKQAFWKCIAAGMPSETAALACGVSQPLGPRWFREAGGMAPISLGPHSGRYLSFAEREELALLRAQRHGVREIARRLGRSPSTVSRELRRNAATHGGTLKYRATVAQWKAERAAKRPKTAKLAENERLRAYVQARLAGAVTDAEGRPIPGPNVPWKGRRHGRRADRRWGTCWSPEQISRRLRIDFPHDEAMRISHEAIYQALYVQGRGALRRELSACLRTGRALRVPRARTRQRGKNFITPEVMISRRPAEIADRAVPGHGAEIVRDAIAAKIATLPEQLRKSLTWDQGAELAQHVQLRIGTGLAIYFCDPRSPWQRGTNENTNGLLRQYFP